MKKFLVVMFCFAACLFSVFFVLNKEDVACYDDGYAEGQKAGHESGYNEGYDVGYDEGYNNGLAENEEAYNEEINSLQAKIDNMDVMVWYTSGGDFYHAENCSNISSSKTKEQHSLSEAIVDGRSPCPDCMYPETVSTSTNSSYESSETVYITNTGSKYHRYGCQYLRESSISIDKNKAIDRGYTACSRCW